MTARPAAIRVALGVYAVAFAIGTATHARDFLSRGLRPYAFAPPWLEVFWSALIVLDASVLLLLVLRRRRAALLLAAAIMVADVAANAHAVATLPINGFPLFLVLQATFLGYVLGSAPFLWPASADAARAR